MSDEETKVEGQSGEPTAQQRAADEAEARRIGWRPKEQFHGDPETWVDATEFLRRGKEYIPILRANNQKQEAEIGSLRERLEAAERLNNANQAALKQMQETQQEMTTGSLEAERDELTDQIAQAHEGGLIREELELRDRRTEVVAKIAKAKEKLAQTTANGNGQDTGQQRDFTKAPEFIQFEQDNPWFKEDEVMAAASVAIGRRLAAAGELEGLTPAQRFAKIAEATKKRFGYEDNARRGQAARVEGGGASGESGSPRGKSYSDMPAEAQQACDRAAKKLVGPGKKFKDEASWRKQYAQDYFSTP